MVQIDVQEAKTQLARLIDRATAGEDVVIARNGRPVARLAPTVERPARKPGTARGQVWLAPDFDETPDEILDAFEGLATDAHDQAPARPPAGTRRSGSPPP